MCQSLDLIEVVVHRMEVSSFHPEYGFSCFAKALDDRGATAVLYFEAKVVGWYCLIEVLRASFAGVALLILYHLLLTAWTG